MASTELISSVAKPKKKVGFAQYLGDYGRLMGDNVLSALGMSDIIGDDVYKTDIGKKVSQITNPISEIAGKVAMTTAFTSGGFLNADNIGSKSTGPEIYKLGGNRKKSGELIKFSGPTHEEGGIQLGQDEVEGGESMMPINNQSDFIFSNRIMVPNSKQSFAKKSKIIEAKYKLRPNDVYSKKSKELELKKLANQQEAVKEQSNKQKLVNYFDLGGNRYFKDKNKRIGGVDPNDPDINYIDDLNRMNTLDTGDQMFSFNPQMIDPTATMLATSGIDNYRFGQQFDNKYNPPLVQSQVKPLVNSLSKTIPVVQKKEGINLDGVESDFTIPALGYAAQALTNIPGLLVKPEEINSPKVKFDRINLAEQRNEARRARNLGLATARNIGSNDAGQMMNYLSGTTAGLNSIYGNQFNQSLMQEQQANAQIDMREQLANSEIGRYDEQINTQERDAARNLRMQSLSNIGSTIAMAGKSYMDNKVQENQLNVLARTNPYYTIDAQGNVIPKNSDEVNALGGKRDKYATGGLKRRFPKNNKEAAELLAPNPEPGFSRAIIHNPEIGIPIDPTQHLLYPNYPDRIYKGDTLPVVEIVADKNTPKYRNDAESRRIDARKLPGYGVPGKDGLMIPTPQYWGRYPEKTRADMMAAAVQDRANYTGIKDFMTAAAIPAGNSVKLGLGARTAIGAGMFGAGTAAQYSDDESLRNMGQYLQVAGAAEALPGVLTGTAAIAKRVGPALLKSGKWLKTLPPALSKAAKASYEFGKDNPRLVLYPPGIGGKYVYDKTTSNRKRRVEDKRVTLEDTKAIEESIYKQLNGGN